jgi:hypothetical protein
LLPTVPKVALALVPRAVIATRQTTLFKNHSCWSHERGASIVPDSPNRCARNWFGCSSWKLKDEPGIRALTRPARR